MGRELGRYEILERIGSGGMAVVYLARQLDLDRLVALKELSQFHAEDRNWASRFLRESRLAGSLTHANIVTVFDYFQADDTPYIAMEYLERGSLRPYVASLELAQVGGVLRDVLAGLQHAQRRDIVHRDLKPENLLVTAEGQVKIADFGIAKATSHLSLASFNTEAGIAVGTPGYMAPEQAMAQNIGAWSDLYALGCMAYEMCVGALPFADSTEPFALMLRHISEQIPSARSVNPDLPQELSDWIDSLLVKDPEQRVATAQDAWDSLDEILFHLLGPRWQRGSALPATANPASAPAADRSSAFLDPSRIAEHLPDPGVPTAAVLTPTPPPLPDADVPDALPGPFTPPPSDAVVSSELRALDPSPPESYISVDVEALKPPRPRGDSAVMTPPPDLPVAEPATPPEPVAEPASPAGTGADDFVTFQPWPERSAERAEEPPPAPPQPTAPITAPVPAPETGSGRRRVLALGGGLVAAVVVAAVIVLGGGGDDPAPPTTPAQKAAGGSSGPATSSVASGPLSVTVPAGWSTASAGDAPGGLDLEGAVRATPPRGKTGAIVLGLAPASSTTHNLVPATAIDDESAAAREIVKLGGVSAYRYSPLQDGITVDVAPTDKGVATIACEAPVDASCDRVAATLAVDGAKVLALGPDAKLATALGDALSDVDRATGAATRALRIADTPRGQSRAADRARSSIAKVASRVRKLRTGPADTAAVGDLAGAVRAAAAGYGQLASAARGSERGRYNAAAGAVRAARKHLVAALDTLTLAGYEDLRAPRASEIPPLERRTVTKAPTSNPTSSATPTPSTPQTNNAPQTQTYTPPAQNNKPKAKPTPVPSKPTPVPIDG